MHDRDLVGRSDLAIAIADPEGVVLASSGKHAARLGRAAEAVVGRNWRDWTPAQTIAPLEKTLALAVAGTPSLRSVTAIRWHGGLAVSQVLVFSIGIAKRRTGVVAVHSNIVLTASSASPCERQAGAREVAGYVSDLVAELAAMTAGAGLVNLSHSLQAIAGEAGEAKAMLEQVTARTGPAAIPQLRPSPPDCRS